MKRKTRLIALCDQRSFYASCEAVFRPELRNKPIIVLSNNDGCIVAMNEQAKSIGLQKFGPYFKQREIAENAGVNVFSSNYALYGEISRRIMATLENMTPRVEIYSIDEAFCDLDGIRDVRPLARQLRDTIWQQQRIPMGVSIAPTKTLAKLGQYATKKIPKIHGVCIMERSHQWEWLAKRVPISEVWGVGRRISKHLSNKGIDTAYELMTAPPKLVNKIGHKPLQRTQLELNGTRCIPFEWETPNKKNILCSRSFGHKLYDLPSLQQAIAEFAARAAEKLRVQNCRCKSMNVFILTSRHTDNRYSRMEVAPLPYPTADTRIISAIARHLVRKMYKPGYAYAKAGVMLSRIVENEYEQQDMWMSETAESIKLMDTIDTINRKFGSKSVVLANEGVAYNHAMNQANLSPRYLTHWGDIPKARCQ